MKAMLSKFLPLAFLFAILSFGSDAWAQAIDKLPTSTSDGRAFTVLTEKEVDALPRAEKKTYYAWKNSELDAVVKQKEERLEAGVRLIKFNDQILYQQDLILAIVKNNGKYANQVNPERAKLQKDLQQNEALMSNLLLKQFCEDYIAGKPISLKHFQAIKQWTYTAQVRGTEELDRAQQGSK